MFSSDRILALDIGTSKLVLAEFTTKGPNAPVLVKYGVAELLMDSESSSENAAQIVAALRDLIRDNGFKPAPLLMTLPGQAVFPRYVKLPPVAPEKVSEVVAFEAEQSVPFPINEVVWDYQIIGDQDEVELNTLLVAVKRSTVTEMTDCVAEAGLEPEFVDATPMALYNAVRYNYPDAQGCTMVLDMGARSTNLIFVEDNKFFTRSITVAGNAITQEIAKGLGVSRAEAETLKRQIGFVALGGVYAMTDDERADRISKIARNVATRLHAEVNRSINFYRSQQGGSVPKRVLLSGGTSLMPHMDTFFREKLQVDVEFLNPFVNVVVSEQVEAETGTDTSELLQLGCVVGLALRRTMQCPVEINLLPPELVEQKVFRRRIPYLTLSAVGLALAMICWQFYAKRQVAGYEDQKNKVASRQEALERVQRELDGFRSQQETYAQKAQLLERMANGRHSYAKVIESLRGELLPGMWITKITPLRAGIGGAGNDRLRVEGLAYEDSLESVAGVNKGVEAISRCLEALVAAEDSPFAADKSEVSRTLLVGPDRIFRDFSIVLALKEPLGDPVANIVKARNTPEK